MAEHYYPDEYPNRPLRTFINDPSLEVHARKAELLLQELKKTFPVFIPRVQYKPPRYKNTCWYIALKQKPDVWLLNFTMVPSDLTIEIRLIRYFPVEEGHLKELGMRYQNRNTPVFRFKRTGPEVALSLISEYIKRAIPDVLNGKHKAQSRSAVEYILKRDLEKIFPSHKVRHSERPIQIGNGKPLELDLWIPDLKFAIEIQGPAHSARANFHGTYVETKKRDDLKKQWCFDQGIKLMQMDWDGYTKNRNRLSEEANRERLRVLVRNFLASPALFMETSG